MRIPELRQLFNISVAATCLWALLSALWSTFPGVTLLSAVILCTVSFSLVFLVNSNDKTRTKVYRALIAFVYALAVTLVLASVLWPTSIGPGGRTYGAIFEGPNQAAGTIAVLGLVVSIHLASRRGLLWLLLLVVWTSLVALTVAMTGTRAGTVALFVGTIVMLIQGRKKRSLRMAIPLIVVITCTALAALPQFPGLSASLRDIPLQTATELQPSGSQPVTKPLSVEGGMSSVIPNASAGTRLLGDPTNDFFSGRTELWGAGLDRAISAPLHGSGFDTSQEGSFQMAHNQVITMAEELGLVGVALFLLSLVLLVLNLRTPLRDNIYWPVMFSIALLLLVESPLFGWRSPLAQAMWISIFVLATYMNHTSASNHPRPSDIVDPSTC